MLFSVYLYATFFISDRLSKVSFRSCVIFQYKIFQQLFVSGFFQKTLKTKNFNFFSLVISDVEVPLLDFVLKVTLILHIGDYLKVLKYKKGYYIVCFLFPVC